MNIKTRSLTSAMTLAIGATAQGITLSINDQLLVNGGFDTPVSGSAISANGDDDPASWTTIETASAINAGRQVRLRGSNPTPRNGAGAVQFNAGNSDPLGQIHQTVQVNIGTELQFGVFTQLTNASQASTYNYLVEIREGTGIGGNVIASYDTASDFSGDFNNTAWQGWTLDFTSTSEFVTVHITDQSTSVDNQLDNPGPQDGNDFALDDATLIVTGGVIPEPSTTALLGLGGLALILRRRKSHDRQSILLIKKPDDPFWFRSVHILNQRYHHNLGNGAKHH